MSAVDVTALSRRIYYLFCTTYFHERKYLYHDGDERKTLISLPHERRRRHESPMPMSAAGQIVCQYERTLMTDKPTR